MFRRPHPRYLPLISIKARHRVSDELRWPLTPIAVVCNSLEEDADADAWVDTGVDEDEDDSDLLVVSERSCWTIQRM